MAGCVGTDGALDGAAIAAVTVAGGLVLGATPPPAGAAGIVTHAWMALDAVDHVGDPRPARAARRPPRPGARRRRVPRRRLLDAHVGTPGGDYGEEAHWQRFIDAYIDQIRDRPDVRRPPDPDGPCAPEIAHVFGAAGHGMGDEVWDWLFEPNGPGFGEDVPPARVGAARGPRRPRGAARRRGDRAARRARPAPTPAIPDPATIGARSPRSVGATSRSPRCRSARTCSRSNARSRRPGSTRTPPRSNARCPGRPRTSRRARVASTSVPSRSPGTTTGCGPDCSASRTATRVGAVAPAPGLTQRAGDRVDRRLLAGLEPGNRGGLPGSRPRSRRRCRSTRWPAESVPVRAPRRRVPAPRHDHRRTRPAKAGFPRIVPYNPEAGEHVVAFQPAADLAPCTRYRAEITTALVDADGTPVAAVLLGVHHQRMSRPGHTPGARHRDVPDRGVRRVRSGRFRRGAVTPRRVRGWPGRPHPARCRAADRGGRRSLEHPVRRRWLQRVRRRRHRDDPGRHAVGGRGRSRHRDSRVAPQPYDLRGTNLIVDRRSGVLPGQVLALRLAVDPTPCAARARRRASRARTAAPRPGSRARTASARRAFRHAAAHASVCAYGCERGQAFMRSSSGSKSGRLPTRSTRTGNSSFWYMTRSSVPSTACSGGRYARSRY